MNILENVDLISYSTMRLGGKASWLAESQNQNDMKALIEWANDNKSPFIVIGQGSNIVWRDEGFSGLIIINKIKGIEVLEEDSSELHVKVGGGEVWDSVVAWSVKNNLSGIEFLSKIPGSAGAAPVQNIGAYGTEIANSLVELTAYDTAEDSIEIIKAKDCDFGYRTSRFKTTDKRRFVILDITLRLSKTKPSPPFYEALENYFKEHQIEDYSPLNIRKAVTAIRKIKLPDPSVVPNNGSFFINPIIDEAEFLNLKKKFPELKAWPYEFEKVKLSAGWMVEQAGFKNFHDPETGMGTWSGSALVLVNEHAQKTADLLTFKQKIIDKVNEIFGITLEQEPELLP